MKPAGLHVPRAVRELPRLAPAGSPTHCLPAGVFVRPASLSGVEDQLAKDLDRHFLLLKRKNMTLFALYTLDARHFGGRRAAQTPMGLAGQVRSAFPRSGKDELSACPMESGAARTPPIYPMHVTVYHSFVYSLK